MTVALEPVAYADKPVLHRLLELYLYDFTEFTGTDLNEHGEFGYRYLDHYWVDDPADQRFPFFFRVDGVLAGFALVRLRPGRYSMAEFSVMRRYRRGGVGAQAAKRSVRTLSWRVGGLPDPRESPGPGLLAQGH